MAVVVDSWDDDVHCRRGVSVDERNLAFEVESLGMDLDTDKIDDAVLALLLLGLHDGARAWKGFDWAAMSRLHDQGYITDPQSKAKSVVFTEEGLARSEMLLEKLFGKQT